MGHYSQAFTDNVRRLVMTRIHWDVPELVTPTIFASRDPGFDFDFMRERNRASCLVIDGRLDVLQQRSAAMHVQDLKPIADAEHRFVFVVGMLAERFVDDIAFHVCVRRARILRAILLWIDIGLAAGQSTASQVPASA